MPKIANIEETPNKNAVKFLLRYSVADSDSLVETVQRIKDVVSVTCKDYIVTVEKTESADWNDLLPKVAVPIRAAPGIPTAYPLANGKDEFYSRSTSGGNVELFIDKSGNPTTGYPHIHIIHHAVHNTVEVIARIGKGYKSAWRTQIKNASGQEVEAAISEAQKALGTPSSSHANTILFKDSKGTIIEYDPATGFKFK